MLWLDGIVATPLVGLRHQRIYRTSHELLSSARPIVEEWTADGTTIQVSSASLYDVRLDLSNGITVVATPEDFTCEFNYSAKLRERPGQLPEIRHPIEPQPFTDLLGRIMQISGQLLPVLYPDTITMLRVGLVSKARVDGEAPPPGVRRFFDQVRSPWGGRLEAFQGRISVVLETNDAYTRRCHHSVNMDDVEPDRVNDWRVTLDWQHQFCKPETMTAGGVIEQATDLSPTALSYFTRFGSGDLDYDDVSN